MSIMYVNLKTSMYVSTGPQMYYNTLLIETEKHSTHAKKSKRI